MEIFFELFGKVCVWNVVYHLIAITADLSSILTHKKVHRKNNNFGVHKQQTTFCVSAVEYVGGIYISFEHTKLCVLNLLLNFALKQENNQILSNTNKKLLCVYFNHKWLCDKYVHVLQNKRIKTIKKKKCRKSNSSAFKLICWNKVPKSTRGEKILSNNLHKFNCSRQIGRVYS